MKILMTGGGSGGHITPILAVAAELKKIDGSICVVYVGQRGDGLSDVPAADPNIDTVYAIHAGKLRRYANEKWRQLLDVKSQSLNIRDLTRTVRGFGQSLRILRSERPDVVLCKGGFVGVPVGLASAALHIPYVTHDSDSTPGLANRIIARWASKHAVALPADMYPYPASKTVTVGVPVDGRYEAVDAQQLRDFRLQLQIAEYDQVLVVTGGGNGARALNRALIANARYLLSTFPNLVILHIAGRGLEQETNAGYDDCNLGGDRRRVRVLGFVPNLFAYSGAADVVIARAGATNLAEFALQQKACILVPSKQLAWNVKNARALYEQGAVEVLSEDQAAQPERLGRKIEALLSNREQRTVLGRKLANCAGHPHASRDLATVLLDIGKTARTHAKVRPLGKGH